jgi:hypothetical protein
MHAILALQQLSRTMRLNVNSFRTVLPLAMALGLLLVACGGNGRRRGAADTTPLPTGATIDEDGARSLIVRSADLYWEFKDLETDREGTGGMKGRVMIDPARYTSLKSLRAHLATAFTDAAVDSAIADYRVTEQDGKLWMRPADADDAREFDDVDVLDFTGDTAAATASIEVPLGESGQSDPYSVRFRRTKAGWKIANYVFDDEPSAGDTTETEDQ